ncbi:hypothetical protein GCM10017778_03840 [Streptomyces vinaceus]|nr:hypothetical protein GCM10017778_03840 [Streptomyces vinaceus]
MTTPVAITCLDATDMLPTADRRKDSTVPPCCVDREGARRLGLRQLPVANAPALPGCHGTLVPVVVPVWKDHHEWTNIRATPRKAGTVRER